MSIELPDQYESIFERALAQAMMGNMQEAVDQLLRIIDRLGRLRAETMARKPDRQALLMNAWRSAVQFMRWEKRLGEAIAVSERLAQNRPDLNLVQVQIASLMIEQGDVEAGLARMRQSAEQNQDALTWTHLGTEYLLLKRYDAAEACYQAALPVAQNNDQAASTYAALFNLYRERDRVEEALDAWSMSAILDPDRSDMAFVVCRWLIERGDLERAQTYLERERSPLLRRFYLGLHDWHAGQQDEARAQWRQVLDMEVGKEELALDAWIEAALRLGKPEQVTARTSELDDQETTLSDPIIVMIGIAHTMLGNVQEAQARFQDLIRRLERRWPSRDRIPFKNWALLTSLVSEEEKLQAVAPYFETTDEHG